MKFNFLLYAVLLTLCPKMYSQSVNLNKKVFNINYVDLPKKPILNDNERSYSISSLNSETFNEIFPQFYFENEIKLSGFTKLSENGFLNIKIQLFDVQLTTVEHKNEVKVRKNDEGKERRTKYYWAVVGYQTEGKVTVTSFDGSVNETFDYSDKITETSDKTTLFSEAQKFISNRRAHLLNINYAKSVVAKTNAKINELFGYRNASEEDYFWILKSKKHPENQGHNSNFQVLKDALDKMKYDEPVSKIQDEVAPAITYFKRIIDKYPGKDRKSRKLKYASYYNLGLLYYYLDKPEKTLEYANMLLENDKGKSEGKELIRMANELKQDFSKNGMHTRHFEVITEDKANYNVAQFDDYYQKEGVPIDENPDYTLSYVISISGDTIPAYVSTDIISKFSSIMTTHVKDLQGKIVKRKFNASEVEKVIFGNGEKLHTVAFKDASEMGLGGNKGKVKYAKLIFTAGDLKLYLYQNSETVIKRKGEQMGYSTQSAGWVLGFKKRLGSLAKDCPSLKNRVDNKEFTNNSDSLIEFMKAYKECVVD